MKKFIAEFKEFALKGNVMDMAIGVIIGAAFKAIIDALVDCIISPIIGCFIQGGFENWTISIGKAELGIGAFLMAILNFLIIALVLFLMLKLPRRYVWEGSVWLSCDCHRKVLRPEAS